MAHGNETKFWERVLSAANPDWGLGFVDGFDSGERKVSDQTVRIYVVDTSNLWVLAAGTSEAEARKAFDFTRANPQEREAINGSVGRLLADLSDRSADRSSKDAVDGIRCALLAITSTETFAVAKSLTGGYAGHWAYLLYRLNDGEVIARPAYVSKDAGTALMAFDDLVQMTAHVVALDLRSADGTGISRQAAQGGGARLHPSVGS